MQKVKNIYLRLMKIPFLLSLIKSTNQGPQAWKTEDIPATKISIAWQLPQYVLVTAAEVMFSVTGLEFSYSQVGFCNWTVEVEILLRGWWILILALTKIGMWPWPRTSYFLALDSLYMTLNRVISNPRVMEVQYSSLCDLGSRKGYLKIKSKGCGVKLPMFKFGLHNLLYNFEQVSYHSSSAIFHYV